VIELLLAHGADVTARNRGNDSALDIALLGCAPDSARMLARKGARIDLKAANSTKLIEYALRFDCPEVIAGALADGWSPHSHLAGGWPALAVAHEFAADTCEQVLRNAGAQDSEGVIASLVKETELDVQLKSVAIKPPTDPRPPANRSLRQVIVKLLIGADGHAMFAKVMDSDNRDLTVAVLAAVDSWEFTKPVKEGNAVVTRLALPVVFKGPPEPGYEGVSYRQPMVLHRTWPRFPFLGSASGTEMSAMMPVGGDGTGILVDKPSETGLVVLGFDVDANGAVKNIKVKQSYEPAFADAAISALKQWSFQPGISGGRAESMAMELQFRFAPPYYIWTGVPYRQFSATTGKPAVEK
jgi:TonB family protein